MGAVTPAFAHAQAAAEKVLNSRQRFPERVFADSLGHFGFIEHAEASGLEIWSLLQALASQYGDRVISIVSIEPDAFGELRPEYGEAGVQALAVGAAGGDYHRLLTENVATSRDGVGLDLYMLPVLAWLPDSLQWAAWGERDFSTIVFGFRRPPAPSFADLARASGLRPWSLDDVCENVLNDFRAHPKTKPRPEAVAAWQAYCAEFRRNYGEPQPQQEYARVPDRRTS